MENEILNKIISECGSNTTQIPLKVNEKLDALIEANLVRDGVKIKKGQFVREILYAHFLPEILKSRLFAKATDWVRQEDLSGEACIKLNIQAKRNQLNEIIELAEIALKETDLFEEAIIQAETDYLNNLHKKLKSHGEVK